MELYDAIKNRHSIRSFSPEPVPEDLLLQLADAAQQAPTASNLQAWKFLFVTDPALKEKVDLVSPGLSGKPPVILVICSDMEKASRKGGRNSEVYGCLMDASMAAENLMLKAVELGLGTCAIKSFNETAVRKILEIPQKYRIEMLISIGYPEGNPRCPKRPPADEITFFNHFPQDDVQPQSIACNDFPASDSKPVIKRKSTDPELELFIYLITSAKALPDEPVSYGPIRLTEAASKLCRILCGKYPESEEYQALRSCIDKDKGKALTEPEVFSQMLKHISEMLVECL